MKSLHNWTLDLIRSDETVMSWLEERKFDWLGITANTIKLILDGYSVILITDKQRSWFGNYILSKINSKKRPYIPLYNIKSIYPNIDELDGSDDNFALLNDMLELSFGDKYILWYIGKASNMRAKISLNSHNSFNWIFDEEMQNAFSLSSNDDLLEHKLLQMYRIFDKTLDASMFSEVSLELHDSF